MKPLIESPVRIEADGTKALGTLTDSAATFLNEIVMPPMAALAGLVTDTLDALRGPFRALRVRNLEKLAESTRRLRELQGIGEPKALPPKASHVLLEQASFEDGEELRALWAQLIVNAQAGMELEAYLFEVLGKLSSEDVQLLKKANDRKPKCLDNDAYGTERLEALGLLKPKLTVWVDKAQFLATANDDRRYDQFFPDEIDVHVDSYVLTDLGELLLDAATKPIAQILAEIQAEQEEARREEERRQAEWQRQRAEADQKREREEEEWRQRREAIAQQTRERLERQFGRKAP